MATGPHDISESSMAMRLGVTREWIRSHRGPEGDLWIRSPDRQILYAQTAVDTLAAKLGISGHASENPVPSAPFDRAVMTVVGCRFQNRRVITAKLQPTGESVTVWVVDSRKFAPGMDVLGVARPGKQNVYDFAGNPANPENGPRMPRRPGMW